MRGVLERISIQLLFLSHECIKSSTFSVHELRQRHREVTGFEKSFYVSVQKHAHSSNIIASLKIFGRATSWRGQTTSARKKAYRNAGPPYREKKKNILQTIPCSSLPRTNERKSESTHDGPPYPFPCRSLTHQSKIFHSFQHIES